MVEEHSRELVALRVHRRLLAEAGGGKQGEAAERPQRARALIVAQR